MLEQRRLDYLAAMGITQWMPRQPLPHAAPSRWLPDASDTPNHDEVEQLAEQHHIPPVVASELLELEQRSRPSPVPTPAPVATDNDAPADAAPVDLTPPRFELWFARATARGVWVVDGQQDLTLLRRFMLRVVTAMGAEPDLSAEPVQFRWPFIESRQHDQSRPVALQALQAQWQFVQQQGVGYVISVGSDSRDWLAAIDADVFFHIDDLQQCLTSAAHKRALWQALVSLESL